MQFWMVLDSREGASCTKRHYDVGEAEAEAERLAIKEGRAFFLMEAVDRCSPAPKVTWTDLERSSNIAVSGGGGADVH